MSEQYGERIAKVEATLEQHLRECGRRSAVNIALGSVILAAVLVQLFKSL